MSKLRQLLLTRNGTVRIEDSYEPDYFRIGTLVGDIRPARRGAGNNFAFTLQFSADPRRFIKNVQSVSLGSGNTLVSPEESGITDGSIVNIARPVIVVSGSGTAFTIAFCTAPDGTEYGKIEFNAFTGTLEIDANDLVPQIIDAAPVSASTCIADITGEICLLPSGTIIKKTAQTGNAVTIEPRWWVR